MGMESEESNDRRYTSNGQGNLNTVLGAIGTVGALGLLGGNGGLGGIFGGNRPPMEPPATRYDLENQKATERAMTEKDMEIARLKAEKYADAAALATERRLADKIEKIETSMNAAVLKQAEYNVANTATVSSIGAQIAQLMKLTGMVINAPTMLASEAGASAFKVNGAAATTTNG